jgi:hypothetical protein
MWKVARIFVLLVILGLVVQQTLMEDASLDWKKNFYVAVIPINADGSPTVEQYIRELKEDEFEPVADYFAEEGKRYGVALRRPVEIKLGAQVKQIPPEPPLHSGLISVMLWSLKFRWYALHNTPDMKINPNIKLYLLYFNPNTSPSLNHSTALNKGRIGRINVFGDKTYHQQNMVIVAHELLHTLKATDKYDLNTLMPIYPEGLAEPNKIPLYPQTYAELMAGRLPVSESKATIPKSLSFTLIGQKTAHEIGWVK